ncbi:MAG: prephenate dehydrogenase/arogenate dehydrogenase family protein [Bacteroidales bacterium]|nr:prephenate dehydrogenase/arogenate dehydrogenase family protein [Bacteroidales bacterium]
MSNIHSTVGIIGLGLIGGSMAIDLKRRGFAQKILGVEADPVAAGAAKTIGLADELVSVEECVDRSDIIVVAVPVGAAVKMLPAILDRIHSGAEAPSGAFARIGSRSDAEEGASAPDKKIVIDVCSTKEHICGAVKYHPARKQFVCTHPMAGTEYSGPWAAQPGLFDGRACIFADQEESAPWAVQTILELYACLNMRPIFMSSSSHDVHTAYVSHISHVTSFALALTVLDKEKDEKHIFDLASGGFSSTVRLAKSNADMWIPILTQNHDNVLQVMDTYIEKMKQFRDAVASYDEDALRKLIEDANRIKRIIR